MQNSWSANDLGRVTHRIFDFLCVTLFLTFPRHFPVLAVALKVSCGAAANKNTLFWNYSFFVWPLIVACYQAIHNIFGNLPCHFFVPRIYIIVLQNLFLFMFLCLQSVVCILSCFNICSRIGLNKLILPHWTWNFSLPPLKKNT